MTKPFDPTKPVQTRDGRPARIICTDRKGEFPIVALLDYDERDARAFAANGTVWGDGPDHKNDLINIPTKVAKYAVMVNGSAFLSTVCDSREKADYVGSISQFRDNYTVVTVTWEE